MHMFAQFIGAVLLGLAPGAPSFAIDLKLQSATASKTAHAEVSALGVKPMPRQVLHVKAGERLRVEWALANIDAGKSFKNVVVHFMAIKEDSLNQLQVPRLDKGLAAESALTMDFAPKDTARGALNFAIDVPGFYLVRIETRGVATNGNDEEYFAALDLVVE
jgi:hypothetical protein